MAVPEDGGEAQASASGLAHGAKSPSLTKDFPPMRLSGSPINYRLGSLYSVMTAFLYATQEPFSFPAARHLSVVQFVCLTQIALFVSIPLLTGPEASRRDFLALIRDPTNYGYLAVIFAIGLSGLILYNFGLSNAHPIIISAILNLSPFWAALVALIISRVPIPISPATFFGCFAGAFIGAMAVAWSQLGDAGKPALGELAENFLHGSWIYAIPVPLCSALGGTLVGKWFGKYDESAAIAANFLVANVILIPSCLLILYWRNELTFDQLPAMLLMIVGTIVAASVGRVVYQIALTVTGGDNGFVTMFLNLVPALTALISLVLSRWISDLHFAIDPVFFLGSALIGSSLLLFSLKSWRQPARHA
jgi:drug/metabolite transporter (DMT)-like permease